jgi:hypothetical protein
MGRDPPDLEALGVAQPWELAPGEEECLLDSVLGPLDIAQDPVGDGVAAVTVQVEELGEGDLVARACSFDQPRSHGRTSRLRPNRTLLPMEMIGPGQRFKAHETSRGKWTRRRRCRWST